MKKSTLFSILTIFLLVPATLLLGRHIKGRWYYLTSTLVIIEIMLLDEPTKGLDCGFKARFAKTLKRLTDEGMTVVMVSHDVEFCAENADIAAMFFDGQIIASGTPREFFGSNSFYTTASNRMSRCIFENAVTAQDVAALYRENLGEKA